MTDDPIREELDAMIRKEQSLAYTEDMTALEDGEALYAVALSLLREKRELEEARNEAELAFNTFASHARSCPEYFRPLDLNKSYCTCGLYKACQKMAARHLTAPPKEEPHE